MTPLSQRDPRWSGIKINGTIYTIGTDGCLLTCLAMIAGLLPDVVASKIGFNGAQVAWTGLDKVGLELIEKNNVYNNEAVKKIIEQYGFCIVRVDWDGSPKSTGDTHFVLYIGNGKLIDPWTGTIEPTSKYSLPTGYRAVRKTSMATVYKTLDLTNQDSMKVAVDMWHQVMVEKLWTKTSELVSLFSEMKVESVATAITEYRNRLNQISNLNDRLQAETKLRIELSTKDDTSSKIIASYENHVVELNSTIRELQKASGAWALEKTALEKELEDARAAQPTPVIIEQPDYVQLFFEWLYKKLVK